MPEALLEQLEDAIGSVENKPRSVAQAKRRTESSIKIVRSVLRSEGYYGFTITPQFRGYTDLEDITDTDEGSARDQKKANKTNTVSKTLVLSETESVDLDLTPVLKIITGPVFTFGQSQIDFISKDNSPLSNLEREGIIRAISRPQMDVPTLINLPQGDAAQAARVVAAELRVLNRLTSNGYPDAVIYPRKAVIDHKTSQMDVTFKIYAGQKTQFGEIIQTGTYLRKGWPAMVAPFKQGETFSDVKLNRLSSRVIGTGAFDGVTAILDEEGTENADGSITRNVLLNIEQDAKNTVSGEIGYSTSDGSGISLSYQRRNYIGYAQTLTLTSNIKTNLIDIGAQYYIPFFSRADRELNIAGEIARENSDDFRGERVTSEAQLTQKFSRKFKASVGLALEASQFKEEIEDQEKTRAYLVQGQAIATYDSRDSLLNAVKGVLAEGSVLPTYNFGENPGVFMVTEANASHYRRVSNSTVLAGRTKIGTIIGADLDSVPLNRRFYGGGGGSVRGYSYQSISPRDTDGERIGGRSIFEASAEVRYRAPESLLNGNLGFVGFVDAASVSAEDYPDFDRVLAGAGVGIRYFTSFAPLRADIAIPLNPRDDDNAFQIYISLGQSF